MQTPISYFTELTDPRVDRCKEHLMEDIVFITIAAVICGVETWNDIENYGKSKESWLKQYFQFVSAWSKANQLSLGQVKVDEKSNEITAEKK
jgi:predicted transposase YbfD/YdcC